ncbi:hypothetical protein A0H81_14033 [Grifola frondosa]|uniref:Uncharacterized protein n=1 Tax=Grifola frondosa TaxID=5627 RepID=A0A1C7LN46_GRIFR|nr:hypothetical protein A0H81_14033 [Grifola frondosa]
MWSITISCYYLLRWTLAQGQLFCCPLLVPEFGPRALIKDAVLAVRHNDGISTKASITYGGPASIVVLDQIAGGIFLWEWATTLYFDWRLLSSGTAERRWPTILYIFSRLAALVTVFLQFLGLNLVLESPFNCDALSLAIVMFAYLSMLLSSALIALRIIAIWNRKIPVVLFASVAFLANFACLLYGIILNNGSVLKPAATVCMDMDAVRDKLNIIVAFVTDVLMLIVMMIGIWRMRGSGSLWRVVYYQGIIWLLFAVLCYSSLIILILLHLDEALYSLFPVPLAVAMTICATRMHRGLYEYANPNKTEVPTNGAHTTLQFCRGSLATRDMESRMSLANAPNTDVRYSEE